MATEMLGWVVLSGFLSSLLTLISAAVVYRFILAGRIQAAVAELGDVHEAQLREGLVACARELIPEFRAEVVAGFEEAARGFLPEFRDQVEKGFQAAGEVVLPQMREEVAAGVREALVGVASVDFVDKTAQNVARKSGKLFENGLSALFGRGKRKKD